MALSIADRVALGLDLPQPGAPTPVGGPLALAPGEYAAAPGPRPLNLRLVPDPNDKATTPRIRALVNELLAGNLEEVDYALKQLLRANPKEGLKLYTEMMEFSMPKLKAVAVAIDDRSEKPTSMSFVDLQKALQGD